MRMRTLLSILSVATVLLAGCSHEPSPSASPPRGQPASHWPEALNDFRFRWSAEPGIDLTRGEPVPLRAYLESWLVISYTGGDADNGYPGYRQATPTPVPTGSAAFNALPMQEQMIRVFEGGDSGPGEHIVGNEELHILSLEATRAGFRTVVCDSTFGVYRKASGADTALTPLRLAGVTSPDRADPKNMTVWRVEFSGHDPRRTAQPAPTRPQIGPLPAPLTDVFGPWFVTGSGPLSFWWAADSPGVTDSAPQAPQLRSAAQQSEEDLRARCLERFRLNREERLHAATTVLQTPPPVQAAAPGWPEQE